MEITLLPANVRYDKRLKPSTKLLYAEITTWCDKQGICYETNADLANLLSVDKHTISRGVAELVKYGYIHTEMVRNQKNMVTGRKIYLTIK